MKILVVDDNGNYFSDYLGYLFGSLGHEMLLAEKLDDGLAELTPDNGLAGVLTDWNLGSVRLKITGEKIVRKAIELHLPVVVWTAGEVSSELEKLRRELHEEGKDFPVVSKLLSFNEVTEAIKLAFEGQTGWGVERRR